MAQITPNVVKADPQKRGIFRVTRNIPRRASRLRCVFALRAPDGSEYPVIFRRLEGLRLRRRKACAYISLGRHRRGTIAEYIARNGAPACG